jgi:hypothetical protein
MPELNEQLTATKYARLSDAIEAGWRELPRLTNGSFRQQGAEGELEAVCALGAASYAAGYDPVNFDVPFPQAWDHLTQEQKAEVESYNHLSDWEERLWESSSVVSVADAIIVLNDQVRLPSEALIALVRRWGY